MNMMSQFVKIIFYLSYYLVLYNGNCAKEKQYRIWISNISLTSIYQMLC